MRTIPIITNQDFVPTLTSAVHLPEVDSQLRDGFDRPLKKLHIGVTDRCNFSNKDVFSKSIFDLEDAVVPRTELLSFEEITRLARQFVAQGVEKIHLSGGEPLLRKSLDILVAQLAALHTPEGAALSVALTTDGTLLSRQAQSLKDAGLAQLSVSLNALDNEVFQRINGTDLSVSDVLAGLVAAQKTGFSNIKVNMVVKRGVNDQEVLPMVRHFQGTGITLQMIEYTAVDNNYNWYIDQTLPSAELFRQINRLFPLLALPPDSADVMVERWGFVDAAGQQSPHLGEIRMVSTLSNPICGACDQARLTPRGQLHLCFYSNKSHDFRTMLRRSEGIRDTQLQNQITSLWRDRMDRSAEIRTNALFTSRIKLTSE